MIRIVIGVVLCACSIYIGYGIRRYYRVRADLYRDLIIFIDRLIDEISFIKPPLAKIIGEFSAGKGELSRLLGAFGMQMQSAGSLSAIQLTACVRSLYMTAKERELFVNMLLGLGTMDSVTQLHNLHNFKSRFEVINKDSDEKLRTVGALSFKLGVLMGILAMIIVA